MKAKKIIVFIIIGLFILLAALLVLIGVKLNKKETPNSKKEVTTTKVEKLTDKEYSISLNESISIEDLNIELTYVEDSRCPAYTECYWPGELEYDLLINGKSYELSTVNKPTLEYKNYVFKIVSSKCDGYKIVFEIERK